MSFWRYVSYFVEKGRAGVDYSDRKLKSVKSPDLLFGGELKLWTTSTKLSLHMLALQFSINVGNMRAVTSWLFKLSNYTLARVESIRISGCCIKLKSVR